MMAKKAVVMLVCAATADAFLGISPSRNGAAPLRWAGRTGRSSSCRGVSPLRMSGQATAAKITPAHIEKVSLDIKARHTPAIADEIRALFMPLTREQKPVDVKLDSTWPADFPGGALLRIGPNPRPGSNCPGFLDADGMLTAIVFPPPDERADKCYFSTAWLRTAGYEMEEAEGKDLFLGTLGAAPRG